MDKSKIKAAARKALIAADHKYHSWPEQQQEQFRATMSGAAQDRVAAVLLKYLQHNNKSGQYSSAKVHRSLTVNADGSYSLNNLEGLVPEEIDGF